MIIDIDENEFLEHYGTPRHSGRYPWGSGGNVDNTNNASDWLSWLKSLRSQGISDVEIGKGIGMSTTQLRATQTIALAQQKQDRISTIEKLRAKGVGSTAISRQMGIPEPTVRSLMAPEAKRKADVLQTTVDTLRTEITEKGMLDVGRGQENWLGVSREKLNTAVSQLVSEGYIVRYPQTLQPGGKKTSMKVLAKPGTTYSEVADNLQNLGQISKHKTDDDGLTNYGLLPPIAVNPKRVDVRYAEDGGDQADGVIYVRPGVSDLTLGNARYAQVRIQVGEGHYLKGMAMYKDDLPSGVDLLFNTNKSDTGNKLDSMKPLLTDRDNPFGSMVDQIFDEDPRGKKTLTSAMNIVNEEGNWSEWSKTLSSQVLSKQTPRLAKEQLTKTYDKRQEEYEEIMALTNPTVRRKLLEQFSETTDSAAVHLKAAGMPRQASHVILPIESMPETQVYAPNYDNGEIVVLIRYPHGGTFEIPRLTVNNNQSEAKKLMHNAKDAIGINAKVAERLSGADFDGDTVLVIPDNGKLKATAALEGLKDFNQRVQYRAYEGMPPVRDMQNQMGQVSNLITDMTIKKAPVEEIVRAVRHSMVVIDSEKHELDYRKSAKDNGIAALKAKYQGGPTSGASTLISRAGAKQRGLPAVRPARVAEGGPIDKKTGEKLYVPTGETYVNKKGETVVKTRGKVKLLAVTKDAHDLSSGTPIERLYADHSNKMKTLANRARLDMINTPRAIKSSSAAKAYATEVQRLNAALDIAERNAPVERRALAIGNAVFKAKLAADPTMDETRQKRERAQAIETARARVGAKKERIVISEPEWEAIQAGALADTRVRNILDNADMDVVRKLATPKFTPPLMSTAKIARAQALLDSGATRAEVAKAVGVSLTSLDEVTDASR